MKEKQSNKIKVDKDMLIIKGLNKERLKEISLSLLSFAFRLLSLAFYPLAAKSKSNIFIAESLITEPGPKIAAAPASYKN